MIKNLAKHVIKLRRTIHMNPELGNQEYATAKMIEHELSAIGIPSRRVGRTGVVAVLSGNRSAKNSCIAIRADMDALPVKTQIKTSYASRNAGCMHACGHDANMATVLGSAHLLAAERDALEGKVKFIFQPNEESADGALNLIRNGVLMNPKVHAILGLHVSPHISSGSIGIKRGAMMAAVDRFTAVIIGEGGHGAYPHEGKDAIAIAGQIINAFQTLVSRSIDPTEPVVVTIGRIQGGERFNILPARVLIEGTVRTLSHRLHHEIPKKLERLVRDYVRAWGGDYTWKYEVLGDTLINDDHMIKRAVKAAGSVLGSHHIAYLEKPSMGGEDFAEYLKHVPGCFVYLGTKKNKRTSFAWHHPRFDIDEGALIHGARFLARTARDFLQSNGST
ncbi:MAG: amidohydrolase [Elusimicrobia bacterium]|nr:amidohydrolase [Elusimicrobiota bacterium]MBD3412223.1 amidohydrolase [Elusimicrobiota bacterium]